MTIDGRIAVIIGPGLNDVQTMAYKVVTFFFFKQKEWSLIWKAKGLHSVEGHDYVNKCSVHRCSDAEARERLWLSASIPNQSRQ